MIRIKAKKIDYDLQINLQYTLLSNQKRYSIIVCDFDTGQSVELLHTFDENIAENFYIDVLRLYGITNE